MILEAIFKGNDEQAEEYHKLIKPLLKADKYGGQFCTIIYILIVILFLLF